MLAAALPGLKAQAQALPTLRELFAQDPWRGSRYTHRVGPLTLDLSRQRLDLPLLESLLALADAGGLKGAIAGLLGGDQVNASEARPALHPLLRRTESEAPPGLRRQAADIAAVLARMEALVRGQWGEAPLPDGLIAATDIVNIGIGGSDLGPRLVADALATPGKGPRVHFLANVDGHALERLLPQLDPARTLVLIVSKSFGTQETRLNAESIRAWFAAQGYSGEAWQQRVVAVSANVRAATAFGIAEAQIYPMWDYVGGRYSVWSAAGLGAALAIGWDAFRGLLDGAALLDRHFQTAPLAQNLPVLKALATVVNRNLHGLATEAVISYDERLRLLPEHLQQLRMESNGKGVCAGAEALTLDTAPVLFGGLGTNVQHSFMQALHQGTQSVPVDFIGTLTPDHDRRDHHDALLANLIAQAAALMQGRSVEEALATVASQVDADTRQQLARQKAFPGNRPSSLLWLDRLTPQSLGALIALYEHQTYVESRLWGINAFDQWGVELGKEIATRLLPALADPEAAEGLDPATRQTLAWLAEQRRR